MKRPAIVKQISKAIHAAAPTAQAILFGSEARGDARADSDIDLLVLLDGDKFSYAREVEITGPLYEIELKTGISISPIVMLKKQWENRPFQTPFALNIQNEGIEI